MAIDMRAMLLAHPGQSYNPTTGQWSANGGTQTSGNYASAFGAPASGPGSAIYQNQQAQGMINPDGTTAAGNQYAQWQASGAPSTVNGQTVDSRGQAMDPSAWDSTFSNMTGGTYQPGSQPLVDPNSPWATNQGGVNNPNAPQGRDSRNAPGGGNEVDPGYGNMIGPGYGQPGGPPTTLGGLAGGLGANMNIPGQQPNYPLNISDYLNPMMQYQMQNGFNTINNGQAAAGALNSGDTMKQLMQYGMGVSGDSFNKAAGIAGQQQAFGYGVDNNDRNFQYQAQVGDRDYNLQRLMGMANLGLGAAGQQGLNDRTNATLQTQLGMGGAQAASTGAIGAGNTVTSTISQMIANYLAGQTANAALPKP